MINYKTKNTSWLGNTCQYIILHHTASLPDTIKGVLNWFVFWKRASAHYVIDYNGDTYSFNTDRDILRHAWASKWWKLVWMNAYSIGIEVIGPDEQWGFSYEQKVSVKSLIRDLMKRFGIKKENVLTHKMVSPGRKVDIYDSFRSPKYPSRKAYQDSL